MFRCNVCKKIYPQKVLYCDCGNDTFEQIAQTAPQKMAKRNPKEIISWVIFSLCLIASVLVWFI